MKKLILGLSFLVTVITFNACSGFVEQDITNFNNVSDVITQGDWKVNTYLNNNLDETSDFSNYTFRFKQDGSLVATTSNQQIGGTWVEDRVTKQILIRFTNNDPTLDKISDVWSINSQDIKAVNMVNNNSQNKVLKIAQQ